MTTCPPGKKQLTCDTNCISNCKGTGCVSGNSIVECLGGCSDGYSGRACNIPCFHNCVKCNRSKREDCIRCAEGFFGTRCEQICSSECGQEGCYDNGVCKKDCLSEDVCGNNCLSNCNICNNTLKRCEICKPNYAGNYCEISCRNCYPEGNCARSGCLGCREGFYGNTCIACPENCHSHCKPTEHCKPICDQLSGQCLSGCNAGYWGLHCKNICDSKCEDRVCNQSSGICERCARGHHGENCQKICNRCENDTCDKITGKCFVCKKGFYGVECTSHCVSCPSGICKRLNGNCITIPEPVQDENSTNGEDSSPKSSSFPPLSIAFISFGIISALAISILLHKLCRRSSGSSPEGMTVTNNRLLEVPSAVYISNGYTEINAEDMDPSAGCAILIHSGNSIDTDAEVELRVNAGNYPVPKRRSSDCDSLIIPEWFGQPEEKSSFNQFYTRYLSPVLPDASHTASEMLSGADVFIAE